MSSIWEGLSIEPPNAIFHLDARYQEDTSPEKINVGIGAYRTEEGKPYYFNVVRKAEERIMKDPTVYKEYLPISGLKDFCEASQKFLLGAECPAVKEGCVCTVQGLSGTGSLCLGAYFLHSVHPDVNVYIPNVTWENHMSIFKHVGYRPEQIKTYRYYNASTVGLDFEGLKADVSGAPNGSIVLFHTCAHNPTGVDPSLEEWTAILELCQSKKLVPFFDTAYQGFATGSLENDSKPVRLFAEKGVEFLAAQSYAKNMGLYSERVGAINVVTGSHHASLAVKSKIELIIRPLYSNPPSHGARIVATILRDPALFAEWQAELKDVVARILRMRAMLRDELVKIGCPGTWDHVTKQIGMFSYTGLDADQSERMVNKHHIYMLKSGRISIPGLRAANVPYMAKCIKEVVDWKLAGKKD